MTDSKPRRLSLPAKTSTTEAEPRRRPPLRGPNKALQVRDGKSPYPSRAPEGETERPRFRADGPRDGGRDSRYGKPGEQRGEWKRDARPDSRGERPARPSFGDRPRPERDAERGGGRGERPPRSGEDRARADFRERNPNDRPRFRSDDERRPRPEFRDRPHSDARREPDSRPPRQPRFEGSSENRSERGSWGRDTNSRTAAPREGRSGFREPGPNDRPRFRSDDERRPRPEFRDRPHSDARREPDSRPPRQPRFEGSSENRSERGSWGRDTNSRTAAPREGRSGFREQGPNDRPRFRPDDERRPRPDFRDRPHSDARREPDSRPPRQPRFEGSSENRSERGSSGRDANPRTAAPREERSSFRKPEQNDRPRFRSDDERRPRPDFRERPSFDNRRDTPPRAEASRDRGQWRSERPANAQAERPAERPAIRHDDGTVRLSKRMADLGLCSRREADDYIERGWVKVDGVVVDELGSRVREDQQIELDVQAEIIQNERITILINKPIGYVSGQAEDGYEPASVLITGENHWEEDPCRIRLESRFLRKLAPAGRLDIDSTGLLVLTQDGRIAKQLIGNHSDIEKEYLVRVEGQLSEEGMRMLQHGIELDGVELQPARVSWQNEDQLRFALREGRKRQIRRMCEFVGLRVVGLKRIRIGSIPLGKLPVGQWRYLGEHEKF